MGWALVLATLGVASANLTAALVPRINAGLKWNSLMGLAAALAAGQAAGPLGAAISTQRAALVCLALTAALAAAATVLAGALQNVLRR